MNQREATHRRLHELKMPHLCEQYPPLVEPFTLVGKAKTVFKLIELKAKREQECYLAMRNVREQVDLADQIIIAGLPNRSDQHIDDNLKDFWKHQGLED